MLRESARGEPALGDRREVGLEARGGELLPRFRVGLVQLFALGREGGGSP